MTNIETNVLKLFRPAVSLLVLLNAPAAFAQSGEIENTEGITSYLFSARSVTVVLVLALVGQVVYRQLARKGDKEFTENAVENVPQADPAEKKRYDQEEISKLLKASATAPKKAGRSLEEAIRLSQMLLPTLPSDAKSEENAVQVEPLDDENIEMVDYEANAVEFEPVEVLDSDDIVVLESEDDVMELGAEAEPEIVDAEPVVEAQVQSIDGENAEEA